jgi:hypothetical protein
MSNAFHPAYSLHNIGGIDIVGVVGINAADHADCISGLLRNLPINELLEFSSMISWDCTKPHRQVFLDYPNHGSHRYPNRIVLAAPSRRQR